MSGYLDDLQARLVDASRELSRARRRRVRRRGAVCAALVALVTPPALAATGVWRPQLGDGRSPAPEIATDAPPDDQLAMLSVLRREQTPADRGVASRYALRFVGPKSIEGVRTDSIRLLAQSEKDRGIVLVPVRRFTPPRVPVPADATAAERRLFVRPSIDDALCIYQLDSVDGAGVACHSSADIREGRAWMMLGHRSLWVVPDGVATVRTEYTDHTPIEVAVRENVALSTAPRGRTTERRIVFLDAAGNATLTVDRPTGGPTGWPAERHPVAPGARWSGAITKVAVDGSGLDAHFELLMRNPRSEYTIVLVRPPCLSPRRVYVRSGGGSGKVHQLGLRPSSGDFDNPRWCAGTYRGFVRAKGKRWATFAFRVG